MTAPGAPRPKFRIDPTAPPAPPPPPPPAPAPAAPIVARPPVQAPEQARAPSARTKWLIGGGIVAALVLAGVAVAVFGFGVGGLVYPTKYMLTQSEAPHGLVLSDPQFASQEAPCAKLENPCKVSDDNLVQMRIPDGTTPKEAWVEGFDTPTTDGAPLTLVAMKFASKKEADDWATTATSFCGLGSGHGAILQDDDVVVLLSANGSEANVYKSQVVAKLKAKASNLHQLCSR